MYRAKTSRATSCRPATTAACRRPTSRPTSCRCTTARRRCAATSPTPTSSSTSSPRTSSRSGRRRRSRPAGPACASLYDEYGVAHVYGETRDDVAFGAGWVTARDRMLLLQLGRGPARAAVADVPGIDAFSLVTSGQSFVPSAATEALVTEQIDLLVRDLRRQGPADHRRRAGRGRRHQRVHRGQRHRHGAGDRERRDRGRPRSSVRSSAPAAAARRGTPTCSPSCRTASGPDVGRQAWEDAMLFDDPEAPTTIAEALRLRPAHRRPGHGLAWSIDAGSIVPLDPRRAAAPAGDDADGACAPRASGVVDAAAAPPRRQASNFLVVDPRPLGDRQHARGDGPAARLLLPRDRAADPPQRARHRGAGRRRCPASRCTSSSAARATTRGASRRPTTTCATCSPSSCASPTARRRRAHRDHYLFKGECRPFVEFDAGTLNGTPIRYPTSVHGPVIGTATVDGQPVRADAASARRSGATV